MSVYQLTTPSHHLFSVNGHWIGRDLYEYRPFTASGNIWRSSVSTLEPFNVVSGYSGGMYTGAIPLMVASNGLSGHIPSQWLSTTRNTLYSGINFKYASNLQINAVVTFTATGTYYGTNYSGVKSATLMHHDYIDLDKTVFRYYSGGYQDVSGVYSLIYPSTENKAMDYTASASWDMPLSYTRNFTTPMILGYAAYKSRSALPYTINNWTASGMAPVME